MQSEDLPGILHFVFFTLHFAWLQLWLRPCRTKVFRAADQQGLPSSAGWDRWNDSGIKKLLASPTAIGVFIWNKKRREYDWEEERWVTVRNPRSQWKVNFRPELAIVPLDLWRAVRRKLAAMRRASPLTGKKPSRNEHRPTTLFSGTLFCGYCDAELTLVRSTEDYKQMGCLSGQMPSSGCQLLVSKSTRIIEECLLDYLRDQLLTESVIEQLVARANQFNEELARQPAKDTGRLKAQVKQLRTKIDRLVKKVAETDNDQLSDAYHQQVLQYQKEYNVLQATIRAEEARQQLNIPPIGIDQAKTYLTHLRELLDQDIPVAAEAIRALTGPIKVRQESESGRSRQRWVASFKPNLRELLRRVCLPETPIGSAVAAVQVADTVEVLIDKPPKYEGLADEILELQKNGVSKTALAAAYGTTWRTISETSEFAKTRKRPKPQPHKKRSSNGKNPKATMYKALAPKVAELRDVQKKSLEWIAKELGVAEGTVNRAYDHAHPEIVRKAIDDKTKVNRGRFTHLDRTVFAKIHELARQGQSPNKIATAAGCSGNTVRREIQRMAAERRDNSSSQATTKPA